MSAQPVLISIPRSLQVERVLYATDFSPASERALPIVSAIAHHYGSQVFLAHICPPQIYPLDVPATVPVDTVEVATDDMVQLLHRPELANLNVTVEIENGDPVERIRQYVKKHNIDLVIIGTHGRTGTRHAFMGSVAEELFRTLKCTVLTIGPNLDPRFNGEKTVKSILFPTDLSPESKAVFPYLASLAAEFEAEIVVLHVLPKEPGSNPEARKLAEPLRQELKHTFGQHLSPKCKPKFVLDFGDTAQRILSAADYFQSDLIGLGVREGNEVIAHFRTTAAYRVVVGAACPVLTMRGTL